MAWSRAASAGVLCSDSCSASAIACSTDSALGSGFGPLGARRPSTGLTATTPLRPHQRYSPRQAASAMAMLRGASPRVRNCATQLRMWCGCAAASSMPAAMAEACKRPSASEYMASVRAANRRSTFRCCRKA